MTVPAPSLSRIVAAHRVGVVLGQPHRALAAAGLLVDDARRRAGRRARGASPSGRARPRRRPRPPSGTSCPARRGPRARRRRRRPTTGRAATRRGRRGRCRRARAGTASARRRVPRRRATRLGRSSVRPQQLDLEAGVAQQAGEQLLRRALVARRVDRVEADEALEQLGRLALEVFGHRPGYARPARDVLHRRAGHRSHELALRCRRRPSPRRSAADALARPLAARMRPRTLDEVVGQEHLLGDGSALRDRHRAGPPALDDPLRAARARARRRWPGSWPPRPHAALRGAQRGRGRRAGGAQGARARRSTAAQLAEPTIFFLDEIHRFNKAQQDALLPAVEEGLVTLIGATTENPYFEVNAALLSRCQVYELRPLLAGDVEIVLRRALERARRRRPTTTRSPSWPRAPAATRAPRWPRWSSPPDRTADVTLEARRGRAAAPRAALRQGRRPPLRHDLGLDQGHARLGPRRRALLPRGHARGRRGPALHRAAHGHPRLRGHRQRRPARARGRDRRGPGGRARRHARGPVRARPGGDLPLARAEVRRAKKAHRRRARPRPRARRQAAAGLPAERRLQRRGAPRPRRGYDYPHDRPGHVSDQELAARGRGGRSASTRPTRPRRRCASAWRRSAARAGGSLASPWRRPQPLPSWSPSARPPASDWARWRSRGRATSPPPSSVAASVQPLWATLRLADRARYMARAAQAVIDEFDELADLIVAEQGRPRAEVEVMELLAAVETLQWLAEHGPAILAGERIPFSRTQHPVKRGRWSYEPLGVVAVLGPAAEPFATPLGDVAVALMAGNGVVLKPSPHVPLCGERIARVFARAGLPEGLLQVVHGHADAGAALVDAPGRAGPLHRLGARRARGRRGVRARPQALGARARRQGRDARAGRRQRPARRPRRGVGGVRQRGPVRRIVERALCVPEVPDRFLAGVVAAPRGAARRRPAPTRRRRSARSSPASAPSACARWSTRPSPPARRCTAAARCRAAHYAPAVLSGVTPAMRLAREEVPGPVLVVEAVDDEEQAIARANDGDARARRVGVDGRPLQGRAHRPRAARGDGVDERPPRRALGARRSRGAASAAPGSAAPAARSRCARAPSRRSSPGTRPSAARCGGSPTTTRSSAPPRAVAGLRSARDRDRERAWRATASRCCGSPAAGCGRCAAVRAGSRTTSTGTSAACRTAWETEPSSALPTRPSPRVPITNRS